MQVKRIKSTHFLQAKIYLVLAIAMILCPTLNRARASQDTTTAQGMVDLTINRNGVVYNGNQIAGETHFGWREDTLFIPIVPSISDSGNILISLNAKDINMDKINPQLYAIYGASYDTIFKNSNEVVWAVYAPPNSKVTIASNIQSGVISYPLSWTLIKLLGKISDQNWLLLSILIPLLTYMYFRIRKSIITAKANTKPANFYPEILRASPAALTVLVRGFVSRRAIAATVIDLAKRGHLKILVRPGSIVLYRLASQDKLKKHEELLLNKWFGQFESSRMSNLIVELRNEIISQQSADVNLSVYGEVHKYDWFSSPPMVSHWFMLLCSFSITIISGLLVILVAITYQTATSILWLAGGLLLAAAIIYVWSPTMTVLNRHGQVALNQLLATKKILSSDKLIHPGMQETYEWVDWLPIAMVLGVVPQWINRWRNSTFTQPEWLLTETDIHDFDQFFEQILPVITITTESIRDRILPAYF